MIGWILGKLGFASTRELELHRRWLHESLEKSDDLSKQLQKVMNELDEVDEQLAKCVQLLTGNPPSSSAEAARIVVVELCNLIVASNSSRELFKACYPDMESPVSPSGAFDANAAVQAVHRRMSAMCREVDDLRVRFQSFADMKSDITEIRRHIKKTSKPRNHRRERNRHEEGSHRRPKGNAVRKMAGEEVSRKDK